jgi:putative oxidoreductase
MRLRRFLATRESPWTLLVRLLVGLVVFFPEGLQKLLFPALLGAGRFAKIGMPWPQLLAPLVGVTEIVCGALIIFGLATRFAAIPLIAIMLVALVSTKLPILLGHDVWIFHVPAMSRYGFWSMLHEARADLDMLLGCVYLLIVGGGRASLDAQILARGQASAGGVIAAARTSAAPRARLTRRDS